MVTSYTELGLRKPALNDDLWDDEYIDSMDILSLVLSSIKNGNVVVSGLVASDGGGLQLDYAAGGAVVNGAIFTISAGNKTATALTDSKTVQRNFLYVDNAGAVQISTTAPTGDFCLLAVADCNATEIIAVYDARCLTLSNPIISGVRVGHPYRKNFLINGNPAISQRGDYATSAVAITSAAYYLDRWKSHIVTVSGTIQQLTANQPSGATFAGTRSVKFVSTAGTGIIGQLQYVEDYARFAGAQITFSAFVKSNSTNARLLVHDGVSFTSSTAHTGGDAWEKLTVTKTLSAGSITELAAIIAISSADFVSVAISNADYMEFAEAQLELGDTATDFEYRPYGEELALCQRYYEKSYNIGTEPGSSEALGNVFFGLVSGNEIVTNLPAVFKVAKRTVPTVTIYTSDGSPGVSGNISSFKSGAWGDKIVTLGHSSDRGFTASISASDAGSSLAYHWTADAEL